MKYLLLSLIFISIFINIANSQNIEVPLLNEVETEDDMYLLIPISLKYDEKGELLYGLGDLETNEIDSIKLYLKRVLKSKPDFYVNSAAIEIIADKSISIYDFEMLQEEIKRLSFLKVFYVAKSEIYSRISGIWSTGYLFRLPARDELRIQKFYSKRGIKFREKENLPSQEIGNRLKLRKDELSQADEMLNIPPPPPPPPPPPFPKKFDDDVKKRFQDYEIVIIEIDAKSSFIVNEKRVSQRIEVEKIVENTLIKGNTLFVLRKTKTAVYEDYLFTLATIKNSVNTTRDFLSNKKYNKSYEDLDLRQKRELRSSLPLIIIDEPNYIQE